jgi:hypothetical protein
MQPAFNQSIHTPIGQGYCSGIMRHTDQTLYLVRLPINEQTQPHLHDDNCLTPRAKHSGLWAFQADVILSKQI